MRTRRNARIGASSARLPVCPSARLPVCLALRSCSPGRSTALVGMNLSINQQEEDIIRKRFLTQAAVVTTTGPPFVQLVESVRRRLSGTAEKPDASEAAKGSGASDEINQILYGIESYINKLQLTTSANEKEQEVYREKHAELQSSISGCMASIEACKSELEEARRKMGQAKEYEQVKQQILKIPARSVTLLEVEGVKKEIEELTRRRTAVEDVTRRKIREFRSILEAIDRVGGDIDEDEDEDHLSIG
jgi:chromosome segregation ATPase